MIEAALNRELAAVPPLQRDEELEAAVRRWHALVDEAADSFVLGKGKAGFIDVGVHVAVRALDTPGYQQVAMVIAGFLAGITGKAVAIG